jgi:hypothetical protein
MGIQMSLNQENWGTLIENASLKDCGFVTAYSVIDLGSVTAMSPTCAAADLTTSARDMRRFKPEAVVVQMGWWDSFQHLINGSTVALGQPLYDTLVEHQIRSPRADLRSISTAAIYLLSVSWMMPVPLANGLQESAASSASPDETNALIKAATQSSKAVHFVSISPYITPSGQYDSNVHGGTCRASDGIDLYCSSPGPLRYVQTQCGLALQRGVLSLIRQNLADRSRSRN